MTTEKIAIIGGAGELGFGLALRWAKAGENVIIDAEGLSPEDLATLRAAVDSDPGFAGKVIFHE